jgi:hypothetical protein
MKQLNLKKEREIEEKSCRVVAVALVGVSVVGV